MFMLFATLLAVLGWPDVLPLARAVEYTGLSRWTLMRHVQRGELAIAGRRGRSPSFRRSDLDALLSGAKARHEEPTNIAKPAIKPAPVRIGTANTNAIERLQRIAKSGLR
jgi:hypothetical protein